MLMIGTFVAGLGVGVASQIVPTYVSEISPNRIRGSIVSFYNFSTVVGPLASLFFALAFGRNWRLLLGILAIPGLIQFVLLFSIPESQKWYAVNERYDECYKVLLKIYD
jgi:MFS family permease